MQTKKPVKRPSSSDGGLQIHKFREAARELETDDDEERFDSTLKRIAKAPPPKDASDKKDKPGQ